MKIPGPGPAPKAMQGKLKPHNITIPKGKAVKKTRGGR